jgi:hypothetical protein
MIFGRQAEKGLGGFFLEACMGFALNARLIDFGEHSRQQLFGRSRADAGSLQNFSALPGDLPTPLLDIRSDELQIHSSAPCSAV